MPCIQNSGHQLSAPFRALLPLVATVPRSAIQVVLAVALMGREATYYALQKALGLRSISGVKHSVRVAESFGLVRLERAPGRGRTTLYLTDEALAFVLALKDQ